ncbi:MAG: glycine zipper 2TM domain-containing protein [Caldimonas sp.]
MHFKNQLLSTAALSALALVTACSSTPMRNDSVAQAPIVSSSTYTEYGQVTSIEVIPMAARPSGAGAILGAVIGGVVGNQFGSGTGRALATGAGAVGGAVAGNAIETRQKRDDEVYRVGVRLDNGAQRYIDFHRIDDLRVGDRVRFDGGQLYRY